MKFYRVRYGIDTVVLANDEFEAAEIAAENHHHDEGLDHEVEEITEAQAKKLGYTREDLE
jgi:hypothetical protein